jgi:hypothetical protein
VDHEEAIRGREVFLVREYPLVEAEPACKLVGGQHGVESLGVEVVKDDPVTS